MLNHSPIIWVVNFCMLMLATVCKGRHGTSNKGLWFIDYSSNSYFICVIIKKTVEAIISTIIYVVEEYIRKLER